MIRAAALVLFALTTTAYAQDLPTLTLSGTVLDTTTNHPIPRALVASQDHLLAAFTDAEGRFSFPVVPLTPTPITVDLLVNRPGYLPGFSRPVHLTASTPAITLGLTPAASITGHLSAPGLDAAAGVRLALFRRVADETGQLTWLPQESTSTDSHGDYHFNNLETGTYAVGSGTWFPDDLTPPFTGPVQQYPATWYGGSPDVESSVKLTLAPGASPRADLQLHPATYYPVQIPLTGGPTDARGLRLSDTGGDLLGGLSPSYAPDRHVYQCWLQPGAHTLTLTLTRRDGVLYGQLQVNVLDAPLRTLPLTLASLGRIPVHVHTQFSHPEKMTAAEGFNPGSLQPLVSLGAARTHDPASFRGSSTFANPDKPDPANLELYPLTPGDYRLNAFVLHGYVAAMSSGGTDLLRQPLTVDASATQPPIEVTLRDDFATLEATLELTPEAQGQEATLALLPTDTTQGPDYGFVPTQSGSILVENLAPGTYRAFGFVAASQQLGPYNFRDPTALPLIEAKAPIVTVLPDQHLTLTVPVLNLPAQSNFRGVMTDD